MKTKADLDTWLDESVPVLVYNQILCARSVKACSGISPAFVVASRERGFDAYIKRKPGHVVAVVHVKEGWFEVDLSFIQFEAAELADQFASEHDPKDPYGERRARAALLDRVEADPFATIKVTDLGYTPSGLEDAEGYEFDFDKAAKAASFKESWRSNPSEEVLNGADLYHVTYYCNLKSIARRGLVAGHGKAIGRGNFSHSRGRVFLTEADGILFWMERYEAFAEHDSEDVLEDGLVPVVLMFTDSVVTELVEKGRLEDDALGTRDANAPAYYVEDLTITPDEILVWNGQEWTTIDDWESIDPESSFQWVKDEDFEEGGFFQFKDLTDIQLLPPEGQK